ncbi:MAG: hypothetical protein ACT443_04510 [Gemmatimonadota bacterium]
MKADRRVLYVAALALLAGLGACDRTDGLGDLTAPAAPQFSHNERTVQVLRYRSQQTESVTYVTAAPIGKQGGVLEFDDHKLVVQKNSVRRPTYFSATLVTGDYIRIDLNAWEMDGGQKPVTTFQVTVRLVLDLDELEDQIGDRSRVVVVYHNPNGTLEIVPSVVDRREETVTAFLSHFSEYSPATN